MFASHPHWLIGQMGLVCVLACSSATPAPSPSPSGSSAALAEWATALVATGDVSVTCVTGGPNSGGAFIGGEFSGAMQADGHQLVSRGLADGFVGRVSAMGKVLWLRRFGTSGRDRVTALATVANSDALVLAGDRHGEAFVTTISVGGQPRPNTRKPQLKATGHVHIRDFAVGNDGGVVVVGHFSGNLTLGSLKVASAGAQDAFVARLGPNLTPRWLIRAGGRWADHAHAVAIHGDQVVVAGGFMSVADFGVQRVRSRNRSYDGFIASFDLSGSMRWVKPIGGDRRDSATALAIDSSGTLYVAGTFSGAASFGGEPLMAVDGPDVFLAAFTLAGKNLWSKRFGGSSGEHAHSLVTKGKQAYLLGSFIGTTRMGTYPIQGERKHDGFVAIINDQGKLQSARAIAGKGDDSMTGLAIAPSGQVFVVGSMMGTSTLVKGKPFVSRDNYDKLAAGFVIRVSP